MNLSKPEFAPLMAYLAAGVGLEPTKAQVQVYFDLLKDLSAPVLEAAIRRTLLTHTYHTLPPVGMVRSLAMEVMRPAVSPAKAWTLVRRAMVRFGPDRVREAMATLPMSVANIADAFGWRNLCNANNGAIIAAQFQKFYAQMDEQSRREESLPAIAKPELPMDVPLVENLTRAIGVERGS